MSWKEEVLILSVSNLRENGPTESGVEVKCSKRQWLCDKAKHRTEIRSEKENDCHCVKRDLLNVMALMTLAQSLLS